MIKKILIILIPVFLLFLWHHSTKAQTDKSYSFLVAGHAYGAHQGDNPGLYPSFFNHLKNNERKPDFLILNGDFVRHSDKDSWDTLEQELGQLSYPAYLVLGNHDDSELGRQYLTDKYGNTYYQFQKNTELYLILDTMKERGRIPQEQLEWIAKEIQSPHIKNVFIFFHELIWTAHNPKYGPIRHNFGTYNRIFRSNFWEELIPLLKRYPDKNIYIMAGDLGGNAGASPAFYERLDHIRLIASGMGEIPEENYIRVHVKDGMVTMQLIALNQDITLPLLDHYNLNTLRRQLFK